MKKLLIGLALLATVAAPLAALAVEGPQECCKLRRSITVGATTLTKDSVIGTAGAVCGTVTVGSETPDWGMFCILNTLYSIVDWTFTILLILAVFFTILGAATIIMAGGKAENVTKGKDFILYAAIGLAVAFLARALPGIVKSIAGF